MHIRTIDLADRREWHDCYASFRAAWLAENEHRPVWSEHEMEVHLREPIGEEVHPLGAFEEGVNGRLLGGAMVAFPMLDNTWMAYTDVFVTPEEQGRGVGSALVDDVIERAVGKDRSVVLAESAYGFDRRDDHPYRRFAERHGFALASTEVSRRLDLPVPAEQIQAWLDEAAPHHRGYRIESYSDTHEVPDALVPSLCHVVNQLSVDAPTGDIEFEADQMTPEIWRQRRGRERRQRLKRYDTVAVDSSAGVIAATTLAVPDNDPHKVHQWATIVLQGHRGHRLGLALKAANLRELQRAHPDRVAIFTSNSEQNGPMVDINERLGFKPVELMVEFQRRLDSALGAA